MNLDFCFLLTIQIQQQMEKTMYMNISNYFKTVHLVSIHFHVDMNRNN